MKSLYELVAPYDSVSLIGMCKNAGKTTTLNQLIAELKRNGVSFGATSVGRDGESTDLVTNTVKPGIFVYKGTIVATAADLLKYCDTTREILCSTGIYTPMGEIIIFRARTRRICADCRTIHDQSAGGSIGVDPPLWCGQDSDRRGTWTKKSLFQKSQPEYDSVYRCILSQEYGYGSAGYRIYL